MPASATTQNYGLHIYRPGDTCNYLTTYNDDMTTIDAQMKANQTAAAGSASTIATLQQSVNALDTKVSQLITRMNNIEPMTYTVPRNAGQGISSLAVNFTRNRQRCFGTIECQMTDSASWLNTTQIFNADTTKFIVLVTWPNNPFNFSKGNGLQHWTEVGHIICSTYSSLGTPVNGNSSMNNNFVWINELGLHIDTNITYLTMRITPDMYSGTAEVPIKKMAGCVNFLYTHI